MEICKRVKKYMNMKIIIVIVFAFLLFPIYSNDINIDNTKTNEALPSFFTGTGMADVLSGLNFVPDPNNKNKFIKTYFNPEYLKLCKALKVSDYRFPEGTSANYYHFYGKGSGLDSSEIFCNETYYGIGPNKIEQYKKTYEFQKKIDKNYAYYFADFMHEMQSEMPHAGFYYHLNTHTHIYQGQLKNISSTIQQLINIYFNQNNTLLNDHYEDILQTADTNKIKVAIDALQQLRQDTAINNIKKILLNNRKFQYHFQENLNSIRYFMSENLNIKGIEMGNETEAEYMLFDDDFSHLPYQCGVKDDDIVNPFSKLQFRDYVEGLIKNWILITLYADSIHYNFNIPIGVTISGVRANVGFKNNEPYLLAPFGNTEKSAFFWARFFATEPKINALIPHIYTPRFIDCDKYTEALKLSSQNDIHKNALKFIDFYLETSLPFFLNAVSAFAQGKPLWITEWNFNMHSFVPNTFLHSYFLFKGISKHIENYENKEYNIQTWLLHYLSSSYYAFALIKAGYNKNADYNVEKMLPYEAYYIWNNTLKDSCRKINVNLVSSIQKQLNNQIFINKNKDKIYIHYANTSDKDDSYDLSKINITSKNNAYAIDKISTYQLVAKSYVASNYVECNTLKSQIPMYSYKILDYNISNKSILPIPAYSIGVFNIDIKTGTEVHNLEQIKPKVKTKCRARKK
jgi:hypothetical protein